MYARPPAGSCAGLCRSRSGGRPPGARYSSAAAARRGWMPDTSSTSGSPSSALALSEIFSRGMSRPSRVPPSSPDGRGPGCAFRHSAILSCISHPGIESPVIAVGCVTMGGEPERKKQKGTQLGATFCVVLIIASSFAAAPGSPPRVLPPYHGCLRSSELGGKPARTPLRGGTTAEPLPGCPMREPGPGARLARRPGGGTSQAPAWRIRLSPRESPGFWDAL